MDCFMWIVILEAILALSTNDPNGVIDKSLYSTSLSISLNLYCNRISSR